MTTRGGSSRRCGPRRVAWPPEPANLQQANQSLNDKLEDLRRGRTPMSEWDQIAADWRRTGGDEGREYYQQALANRDAQLGTGE